MPVGLDDLAGMSPSVERSLQALLDFQGPGSVEDVFALTFSSEIHRFGQVEEVPLKPGGQDIPVVSAYTDTCGLPPSCC